MKNIYGVVVQPGTTRDQKMTGWRIYRPIHKQVTCIGCRNCELCCPDGAIYRIDKKKFAADMDACKGCGICADICPVDDIDMVLEQQTVAGPEPVHADEGFTGPLDDVARRSKPEEGAR
ncbi:MAG: 4Fe-4S dicluster-binding protein [Actinomycetota bacterium]